jgi:hypothetical protein
MTAPMATATATEPMSTLDAELRSWIVIQASA